MKPRYSAHVDAIGRWTDIYRDGKSVIHRTFIAEEIRWPFRTIEGDEAEQMYFEFSEARRIRLEGEKHD